jgi:hypothetical protein
LPDMKRSSGITTSCHCPLPRSCTNSAMVTDSLSFCRRAAQPHRERFRIRERLTGDDRLGGARALRGRVPSRARRRRLGGRDATRQGERADAGGAAAGESVSHHVSVASRVGFDTSPLPEVAALDHRGLARTTSEQPQGEQRQPRH